MKRWVWLAITGSFCVLLYRWGYPLASRHAFRETQTALTTYWLLHGSPWLNYQTPLFGPPWRAPLEFPLFQWITACVAWCGVDLDNAGRLVSWSFLVATVWPLRGIARAWKLDADIVSLLYLLSPVYLYWGTCFLIETCAIFFGAMFLWLILKKRGILAITAGCLSALIKGTAFVPFAIGSLSLCSLPCLVAGLLWQRWTDIQKPMGTLAGVINSTQPAQVLHNYGSLGDRLRIPTIIAESIPELLGVAGLALLVLIVAGRYGVKWRALAAFLVPLLIFPRLFTVHEYDRMENGIFLILLVVAMWPWDIRAISLAVAISQVGYFMAVYAPILREPQPLKEIGQQIAAHTKPDAVLLIYGSEWNSTLPYYAQRRAIMETDLSPVGDTIERSKSYHPDVVMRCPHKDRDGIPAFGAIFDKWGMPPRSDGQCQIKWVAQ